MGDRRVMKSRRIYLLRGDSLRIGRKIPQCQKRHLDYKRGNRCARGVGGGEGARRENKTSKPAAHRKCSAIRGRRNLTTDEASGATNGIDTDSVEETGKLQLVEGSETGLFRLRRKKRIIPGQNDAERNR